MFSKNNVTPTNQKFYKSWKFIVTVSAIVLLLLSMITISNIRSNRQAYFLNTVFNNLIDSSVILVEEIFLSSDPETSQIRSFDRLKSSTLNENNPIRKYDNFVNLLYLTLEHAPNHRVTLNQIYDSLVESKP